MTFDLEQHIYHGQLITRNPISGKYQCFFTWDGLGDADEVLQTKTLTAMKAAIDRIYRQRVPF